MGKKILVFVVCGLMVLLGTEVLASSTLDRIREKGVLVGATTDFDTAPFIISDSGGPKGFDVDLINAIAQKIGVEAKIIRIPWEGGITNAWTDGYDWSIFDLAASTVTITESRGQRCLFSRPYFVTGQVLMTRSPSGSIKAHSDAKGKTLGILQGSTGGEGAASLGAIALPFEKYDQILSAVLAGIIDGAVMDGPVAYDYVKQNADLMVLDGFLTKEEFGVVMQLGDDEMAEIVNQVIMEIGESLNAKWF